MAIGTRARMRSLWCQPEVLSPTVTLLFDCMRAADGWRPVFCAQLIDEACCMQLSAP